MCLDSFLVGLPMELEGGCSGLGVEVLTAGIEVVWRRKSEEETVCLSGARLAHMPVVSSCIYSIILL